MITLSLLHPLNKKPVQHWTFEEDAVIRIGRSTENQVVLYSAVVSRHHVELRQTDVGWEIVNLGTNGTYLDGKRVAQAIAKDGIVIRLARSGPNIQINIADDSSDPMKALRKLKAEAASRTQIDIGELVDPSPARSTKIDEEKGGASSVRRSI
ncbi:MAG: FHA domain-containing protein [Leptolyngbyaceae cyanobacterium]